MGSTTSKTTTNTKRDLTERQQRFVDVYVTNGGNGSQAYVSAGYKAASPHVASVGSAKLLASASISTAITRAQAATQERTTVDSDRLVGMALRTYDRSMELDQLSVAVQSITVLGRLTGSLLDHRSVTVEHREDVRGRLAELPLAQLLAIRERLTADVVDVEAVEVDVDLQGNPREAQKL